MPLNKFIQSVNGQIGKLVQGAKMYGLAYNITREQGSETISFPGSPLFKDELLFAGLDDEHPVIIYHKCNRAASREVAGAYGDDRANIQNAYAMSMLVYIDSTKLKMQPDQFFVFIQTSTPERLIVPPYKQVLIKFTGVVLNSETVFASEYKGVNYPLTVDKHLIQIDYTIESTFKKNCFEKCPEVLTC
jgi:hypothetical protein